MSRVPLFNQDGTAILPADLIGPAGPQGPPGVPPDPYVHDQTVASASWTVAHNLGRPPAAVSVTDSAGTVVLGAVQHIDSNNLRVTFSAPFAGKALVF